MNSRLLQSLNKQHHHAKTNALSIHAPFKGLPAPYPNIYLPFFLYMYLFSWSMPIYIHQCRTPPKITHFTSSYKRFITWCNGVPGEQRELVIKYRSVNVTVFNTMAAVTLFYFCLDLIVTLGLLVTVCITLPHPHRLCMTECFTFKNLVQRPLSLQHTRGWESESEQE